MNHESSYDGLCAVEMLDRFFLLFEKETKIKK